MAAKEGNSLGELSALVEGQDSKGAATASFPVHRQVFRVDLSQDGAVLGALFVDWADWRAGGVSGGGRGP